MDLTNDQYVGLSKLQKWWRKYQHQFIELSGVVGTGTWELLQEFIELSSLDAREVMYLSYNQKQVLELAYQKYHSFYINAIIYNYRRIVDFNSIPVVNPQSDKLVYEWKKEIRSKIESKYKLIVVFDSSLLNLQTLKDLATFGLPVILIRDPGLIPSPDTHTFLIDANIELRELSSYYHKDPIVYIAHKILNDEKIDTGSYDTVSVITKKQLNLYNLRSADMNISMSNKVSDEINNKFRENLLKRKDCINIEGERLIVAETLYGRRITNPDNKKVKIYLTKGIVGYITKINKHALNTKYVPINFRPEFYHDSFTELVMDRHYLNKFDMKSYQIYPDEVIKMDYAYSLSVSASRLSHWDKVTLILDDVFEDDYLLHKMLLYTAITRAKRNLIIVK